MSNQILPFGISAGANVIPYADYEALPARSGGFVSGVARSEQLNTVWRQSSFVASVLAQFIASHSGQDVLDDGDTAKLQTNLELAIKTYANSNLPAASTTTPGITQLSSSINSSNETSAATPKAVKTVNDGIPAFLTGVIGTSRNARMSVTAASATATFTADELIVQESLGGRQYKLTSFNKTINLATIGAGGMDTGTAPVTGFVALYAIYNPTTQVSALLAVNATSAVVPEICAGIMPANYTASALVSVWATTAARLLNIGFQRGRKINIPRIVVITTTTPPSTATSLSLATAVPKNAIEVSGYASIAGASLNSSIIVLSANSNAAGLIQVSAAFSATTNQNIGTFAMTLDVPQAIYWNYSQAGGTLDNTGVSVSTYTF
ncbi:phage tail protein [Yersinia sp. 2553 StPb PI]|uniref:phage tail protein n=1 Tax=Yersinia sp. 2553 StPb PI TaxID=3117411 RepID=UPI003FA4452C